MTLLQRLTVFLLVFGLVACAGIPRDAVAPEVSVADVEVLSLGIIEQRFDVGLRVENPNPYALQIEALTFEVEVNGRPFLRGQSRGAAVIPANGIDVLRVDATTQSQDLREQFRILQTLSVADGVPYRIKGRVKTGRSPLWLPFERTGVYGAPAGKGS